MGREQKGERNGVGEEKEGNACPQTGYAQKFKMAEPSDNPCSSEDDECSDPSEVAASAGARLSTPEKASISLWVYLSSSKILDKRDFWVKYVFLFFFQALAMLERIIWKDPKTNLQEGLLFNLCTIYELESSYSSQKKQKLLELVAKHRGDGFNISCLKIA